MRKKILVVDDEAAMVEIIKSYLEAYGYEAICAYDGEEGLKKIISEDPDLVILDIMLPKIDGYTFVKKLKYNNSIRNVPIIIISAQEQFKKAFEFEGVTDYLLKPFRLPELGSRVQRCIGKAGVFH
ncbi:MAG: response regulator [Candidatus Omnitrophota bacterium]